MHKHKLKHKMMLSPKAAEHKISGWKRGLLNILILLAWLGIWQLIAMAVKLTLFFPTPIECVKALLKLVVQKSFWLSIGESIRRIAIGYGFGIVGGALLGTLSYFFYPAKAMISPLMSTVKAAPVASFSLLAVLWLKPTGVPILIAAFMVAPIVYGNTYSGLAAHSAELREVAYVYGFSAGQCVLRLFIPSVAPYFISACATSFGLAWKAGVAAEVLCLTQNSIGYGLYTSKLYLETPELFAWTAVVVILSVLIEKLFKFAAKLGEKKSEIRN